MAASVIVKKLTKKFGNFTAVDSVSFEVERGEKYGFLGANGAGKTTTIRMLCGLLEPTSGSAKVAGFNIKKDPEKVKRRLGYMSQKFSLYGNLTVDENIDFYAGLYGMEQEKILKRIEEVAEQTELKEARNALVSELPGGIKQRVSLACAIMHDPDIIFLDEPTAGVDPLLRRRFWEIIDYFSRKGTTVFVTTHYMDEVEQCNRVALMNAGRIVKEGTIGGIKKKAFKRPVFEIETADITKAYSSLADHREEIGEISMHGAMLHVIPEKSAATAAALIKRLLRRHGIKAGNFRQVEPTMEDVFVRVVREGNK